MKDVDNYEFQQKEILIQDENSILGKQVFIFFLEEISIIQGK